MRYLVFLTFLACFLVSCDSSPQYPPEDSEGPKINSLDLSAGDRSTLSSSGDTEDVELTPNLQAINSSDVFADRAKVVAVYTTLTDGVDTSDYYASQVFSVIIEEYKGERLVRRSSCETTSFAYSNMTYDEDSESGRYFVDMQAVRTNS